MKYKGEVCGKDPGVRPTSKSMPLVAWQRNFPRTTECGALEEILFGCTVNIFSWQFKLVSRVATAQGKQGIRLSTFPDRENARNLVNLIFYTGKIVSTWGKF